MKPYCCALFELLLRTAEATNELKSHWAEREGALYYSGIGYGGDFLEACRRRLFHRDRGSIHHDNGADLLLVELR